MDAWPNFAERGRPSAALNDQNLEEYQAWLKQSQEARKTREEEREAQDELKLQSVGRMTLVKPFQILEVPMECRDFNRLQKAWYPK